MSPYRTVLFFILCLLALPSAAQDAKPIDNQDVIRLTRAGLSEDLIITKIQNSRTNFDTSTDALLQLKQAGVKERVLAVMLGASETPAKNAAPAQKSNATPPQRTNAALSKHYPTEMGVYVNQNGKWQELPTEKADWKTGGFLKALGRGAIIGAAGVDVDVYVTGPTSSLTAPHQAEFLLRVAEGEAPTAYQLVKLTQKKDRREFKNGRSGWISMKNGPGKAAVPFEANKVSALTFLIKLDLAPGEYCFFKAAAGLSGDSGTVYSFKII